ncbi:MAG: PilZ domain-containing protein [Proteobacteria bacterium]|nr:PilZ domain-containing protein [Pseudomonadota bacterium]
MRLRCRLITLDHDIKAILVDLSRTGARIQYGTTNPGRGDAVLQWYGMEAFGTVVWTRAGYCGLRFHDPLPHAAILRSREINDADGIRDDRELVREIARAWAVGERRV